MSAINNPLNYENFKKQNLSKIFAYESEDKKKTYFYFFRGKRSDYHTINEFRNLLTKFEQDEKELIKEFRERKKQLQP